MTADAKIIVDVEARLTKLEAGLADAERKVKKSAKEMDNSFNGVAGAGLTKLAKQFVGITLAIRGTTALIRSFGQEMEKNMLNPSRTMGEIWRDTIDSVADATGVGMLRPFVGMLDPSIRQAKAIGTLSEIERNADQQWVDTKFKTLMETTTDPAIRANLQADKDRLSILRRNADLRADLGVFAGSSPEQDKALDNARYAIMRMEKQELALVEAKRQNAVSGADKAGPSGSPIASYSTVFGEYRVGPQGSMNPTAAAQKELVSETKKHRAETAKLARLAKKVAQSLSGFN